MLLDKLTELCDATALNTGAAGTYLIGSQIDLSVARDIGVSNLWLQIRVQTTATSGGSATGQFKLASDSTAAISTTTSTVHLTTNAFAVADMTAGTVLYQGQVPLDGDAPYEQFLGILQVTGTAAFTAGAIDAFLTMDPLAQRLYANATN